MTPMKNSNTTISSAEMRYKGVRKLPCGSYAAEMKDSSQKRFIWLGTYNTAKEAARAYDKAARRYLDPRTIINFPLLTEEYNLYYLQRLNRRNVVINYSNNAIRASSRSGGGAVSFPMPNQNPDHEFRHFTTVTGASVDMSMVRDKNLIEALMKGVILPDPEIMGVRTNEGNNVEPLNLELSLSPPGSMNNPHFVA